MALGEALGQTLPPLDHDDRVGEIGVEVQRVEFAEQIAAVVEQPVDVHVHQGRRPGAAGRMHPRQHVGGRGDRTIDIHGRRNTLGEHRLSRTERTGEHHHVPRAQLRTQARAERGGVLGGG